MITKNKKKRAIDPIKIKNLIARKNLIYKKNFLPKKIISKENIDQVSARVENLIMEEKKSKISEEFSNKTENLYKEIDLKNHTESLKFVNKILLKLLKLKEDSLIFLRVFRSLFIKNFSKTEQIQYFNFYAKELHNNKIFDNLINFLNSYTNTLNESLILNEIKKTTPFIIDNNNSLDLIEDKNKINYINFPTPSNKFKINVDKVNFRILIEDLILGDFASFLDLYLAYFLKHFLEKEKNSKFSKEILNFIDSISKKNIFYIKDYYENYDPDRINKLIRKTIINAANAFEEIKNLLNIIDKSEYFKNIFYIPTFVEKNNLRKFGEAAFSAGSAIAFGFLVHKYFSKQKAENSKIISGLKLLILPESISEAFLPQSQSLANFTFKLFDKLKVGKILEKGSYARYFFLGAIPKISSSMGKLGFNLINTLTGGRIDYSDTIFNALNTIEKKVKNLFSTKKNIKIFLVKNPNYKDTICFRDFQYLLGKIMEDFFIENSASEENSSITRSLENAINLSKPLIQMSFDSYSGQNFSKTYSKLEKNFLTSKKL